MRRLSQPPDPPKSEPPPPPLLDPKPQWVRKARLEVAPHVAFCRFCAGLGDLVTIFGGIQAYRRLNSGQIHLIAHPDIAPIAWNHPDIDVIHTEARPVLQNTRTVGVCEIRSWEEQHPRPYLSRIDLFAQLMGIEKPEVPRIYLTAAEEAWAAEWLATAMPGVDSPVALVWRTRSAYKNYPLVETLYHRLRISVPVLIIEHSAAMPGPSTNGLTIRQQAALISRCRLVVTGDTGWLHVAGALQRPLFGLFGSQNPVTRQGPYNMPGAWVSGVCPHGRQPCWESLCCAKSETPPCMFIPPDVVEKMILATLAQL